MVPICPLPNKDPEIVQGMISQENTIALSPVDGGEVRVVPPAIERFEEPYTHAGLHTVISALQSEYSDSAREDYNEAAAYAKKYHSGELYREKYGTEKVNDVIFAARNANILEEVNKKLATPAPIPLQGTYDESAWIESKIVRDDVVLVKNEITGDYDATEVPSLPEYVYHNAHGTLHDEIMTIRIPDSEMDEGYVVDPRVDPYVKIRVCSEQLLQHGPKPPYYISAKITGGDFHTDDGPSSVNEYSYFQASQKQMYEVRNLDDLIKYIADIPGWWSKSQIYYIDDNGKIQYGPPPFSDGHKKGDRHSIFTIAFTIVRVAENGDQARWLIRVADGKQNCAIQCVKELFPARITAGCMAKFPFLFPTTAERDAGMGGVYANMDQLDAVGKHLGVQFRIFSKLQALARDTKDPWMEIGKIGGAVVPMVVNSEHATIHRPITKITKVVYTDEDLNRSDSVNVVDTVYEDNDEGPQEILAITEFLDGEFQITKKFRPSSISLDPADDSDPMFFGVHKATSMHFRLFKRRFGYKSIRDPLIVKCLLNAERYIGNGRFLSVAQEKTEETVEIDQNKQYQSGHNNEFYVGYPRGELRPVEYTGLQQEGLAFVVLKAPLHYPAECNGLSMKFVCCEGNQCIPAPLARYLQIRDDQVDFALIADIIDINIPEFINEYAQQLMRMGSLKLVANSFIGRFIAGGLSRKKKEEIPFGNNAELQRLIFECKLHGYDFLIKSINGHEGGEGGTQRNMMVAGGSLPLIASCGGSAEVGNLTPFTEGEAVRGMMEVSIPSPMGGLYHLHSYVLAYARISMMQMHARLEAAGCKIYAWNTDSFVVSKGGILRGLHSAGVSEEAYGGWKVGPVKGYYAGLTHITSTDDWERCKADLVYACEDAATELSKRKVPATNAPIRHTLVLGPAGIGKSYGFLKNPAYTSRLLVPTHELRLEHIAKLAQIHEDPALRIPVYTSHKVAQPTLSLKQVTMLQKTGKIGQLTSYDIVDEAFMYDLRHWTRVLELAKIYGTTIIALGCADQHHKHNDITVDWFRAHGFDVRFMNRSELAPGVVTRHSTDYGNFLDSIAPLEPMEQITRAAQSGLYKSKSLLETLRNPEITNIIASNHQRINFIHSEYKKMYPQGMIRCREVKAKSRRPRAIVSIKITDPRIWWGRKGMTDLAPKGFTHEPAYAVTSDAFQGRTHEEGLAIDIRTMTERHGSFYVALTRTRTPENVTFIV